MGASRLGRLLATVQGRVTLLYRICRLRTKVAIIPWPSSRHDICNVTGGWYVAACSRLIGGVSETLLIIFASSVTVLSVLFIVPPARVGRLPRWSWPVRWVRYCSPIFLHPNILLPNNFLAHITATSDLSEQQSTVALGSGQYLACYHEL